MLVEAPVLLRGLTFKKEGSRNLEGLRRVEDLRVGNLWKAWKLVKWGKMISPDALYEGGSWGGIIPPKFKEKFPPYNLRLTVGCGEQSVAWSN